MKNFLYLASISLLILFVTALQAQQTKTIASGSTTIHLSCQFLHALTALGIEPGVIKPSALKGEKLTSYVTGGAIDLETGRGEVIHSGGLTLSNGTTKVQLQSFILNTIAAAPVMTGIVVADETLLDRIALFNLKFPVGLTFPLTSSKKNSLRLDCIGVSLTAVAASTLNQLFNVTAFDEGFYLGVANVNLEFQKDK